MGLNQCVAPPRIKFPRSSRQWHGDVPETCTICRKPIGMFFIDGKLSTGTAWANMCVTCHSVVGVGLGTGHGQLYGRRADDTFSKVWG